VKCFVVAGFLLTSASRGPSAIAEPLVYMESLFVWATVDLEQVALLWQRDHTALVSRNSATIKILFEN